MPRKNAANAHDIEDILQEGCRILAGQEQPQYTVVCRMLEAHHGVAVPYYTLRNRFLGKTVTHSKAHVQQQLLSPETENVLVDWIVFLSDTAHPLNKRTIRKKAEALCGSKPSVGWIYWFLNCWPKIQLGRPSGLDPKRGQAFNRPVVGRHFNLLLQIVRKHNIPIENIYNMDEKGCQRGGGRKQSGRKYFVPRCRRPKYRQRGTNLELITIIECVCADGTSFAPGFVFSGKEFSPEWFTVDPKISVAMSENGWTDDFLCKEWFAKSFIPQATARNESGKPILLIYDGHGSHDTLNLIELARERNIILFCLPPHTTHKLQPLDVGVFGPFSRAWTDRCDQIVEDTGEEMSREDFIKEYMDVRSTSFKESTIRTAWRKSGCWPIDQTVFKDDDYAPSISTSTSTPHVPDSFPVLLPIERIEPDFYEYLPDLDKDENSDSMSISHSNLDSDDDSHDTQLESPLNTTGFPLRHSEGPATTQHRKRTRTPGLRSAPIIPPMRPRTISAASFYSQATLSDSDHQLRQTSTGSRLHNRIHQLENDNATLQSRVAILEAHCVMARSEIQDLKQRANAKESRTRKRQKLNVDARCLTSEEGLRLAREQQAVKEAQERKKREAQEQRAAKEAERERLRLERDQNEPFTGALTTKPKPDLQDIAQALGLPTTGGKKDLLERITHYFDANPDLRNTPRYEGLFNRSRGRRLQVVRDENAPAALPTASASASHRSQSDPWSDLLPLSFDISNFHYDSASFQDYRLSGPH